MNVESNGTVGESTIPIAAAVPSELDTQADTNSETETNDTSHENKQPLHNKEINCEDTNDDDEDISTTSLNDMKVSQNVNNGQTEEMLKNNTSKDPLEIKESHEILSNNNHKNTDSVVQEKNCNESKKKSINTSEENLDGKEMNGLDSNHDSDEESCQYVEEPTEDPISTGDNKEDNIENFDSKDSEHKQLNSNTGTFEIIAINKYNSDSEENSSSSEHDDLRAGDTVSLTSDGDDSRDNDQNKSNEVIIIDNDHTDKQNGKLQSTEVHEINSDNSDNDDCVVTAVEKATKTPKKKKNLKPVSNADLRRSSRAIKRKSYNEIQNVDESDDEIEEITEDEELGQPWRMIDDSPVKIKPLNPTILNNSMSVNKSARTPKRYKGSKINQKKPGILIMNSTMASKNSSPTTKASNTVLNHNLCQSIALRGVSVTPVSVKSVETKTTVPQPTQVAPVEPVLPTLTDDMFVVEAPSFIVPYVYEKPATVPFKEFVENLGKEIQEQKAKEEKEALEKKLAEKAKRQQERQEKKERGEKVEESEEELTPEEIEKKKAEKAERKERRRRKKEDDDVSWDGSSSEESEDSLSDDDSQAAAADKTTIIDEIPIVPSPKTDSYFDLSLGKFFMDIGTNLVQEYVQTDLLEHQNRKLRRENRGGHDTRKSKASIAQLIKNLEFSQKANASFRFEMKKCEFCSFKTESALALAHHLEQPHMKNGMYSCNFCSLELPSPHSMLYHMEKEHGKKGRFERAPASHQCINCPFEDNGKGKLARHLIACAKRFKPETNLAPPLEWEHPAKIPKVSQMSRVRAPGPYQVAQFGRNHVDGVGAIKLRIPIANGVPSTTIRPRAPVPLAPAPAAIRPTGLLIRPAPGQPNFNAGNAKKPPNHSYIISTAPRQGTPIQPINAANAKGVVMCEICDGYIKDLEQLRNHMQWIHRIKIHPKMIYNRPPLNCQKCQFRFFTDQGLERHLLGSHGLVTSAIQEAANKGKDAGRCPVCGRAYQRKLLAHVSRDHNLVLKPAHLSYKCTVCTATFGMYRQFENHVYSAHSVVAKKVVDKKTTPAQTAKDTANDDAVKQLKINDDITITPQPPVAQEK